MASTEARVEVYVLGARLELASQKETPLTSI